MPHSVPEHWRVCPLQANWCTVRHPPGWRAEGTDQGVRLIAPDDQGTLTLSCFWAPHRRSRRFEARRVAESLFSKCRRVRPLRRMDDDGYDSSALAGEGCLDRHVPWWRRWWRPRNWIPWRIWTLSTDRLVLAAAFVAPSGADQEAATLAGMIVGSVQFAAHPADPPHRFAERVLELARERYPHLQILRGEEFQIRLGASSINLFNFYRAYVNAPERFEEIVRPALDTIVEVQDWESDRLEPTLADVSSRIMPMLYPEDVGRERFREFVATNWVGGLMVLYVVDESQAYWYIREDLLASWKLSPDELHDLALRNLDAYFARQEMELTSAGDDEGPRLLMPSRPDAYNAARLLSGTFHRRLRGVLGPEFAVGTPNRDFFVAVSLDFPEAVELVRRKILDDFASMDHPLSARLLLVSRDGVSEYLADESSE